MFPEPLRTSHSSGRSSGMPACRSAPEARRRRSRRTGALHRDSASRNPHRGVGSSRGVFSIPYPAPQACPSAAVSSQLQSLPAAENPNVPRPETPPENRISATVGPGRTAAAGRGFSRTTLSSTYSPERPHPASGSIRPRNAAPPPARIRRRAPLERTLSSGEAEFSGSSPDHVSGRDDPVAPKRALPLRPVGGPCQRQRDRNLIHAMLLLENRAAREFITAMKHPVISAFEREDLTFRAQFPDGGNVAETRLQRLQNRLKTRKLRSLEERITVE